jgi:aminoglycoside phosphotransferase (APT) family kinase protein
MTAAAEAGLLVPAVHGVVVVDGRPGLIMDRIDGEDLMTSLARRPCGLAGSASELGRLQARLHDVNAPPELPDLRETLAERLDSPHLSPAATHYLRDQLAGLPDGDRLCHGDFHPGNVVVGPDGNVIIDWPNATSGHPSADLARTMLLLRLGALPADTPRITRSVTQVGRKLLARAWLGSYRRARPVDLNLVRRWETICAAARLSEGIDDEVSDLVRLVEQRQRRGT